MAALNSSWQAENEFVATLSLLISLMNMTAEQRHL